jgi:hypothetical protein
MFMFAILAHVSRFLEFRPESGHHNQHQCLLFTIQPVISSNNASLSGRVFIFYNLTMILQSYRI